jgi:hypothetical protein
MHWNFSRHPGARRDPASESRREKRDSDLRRNDNRNEIQHEFDFSDKF